MSRILYSFIISGKNPINAIETITLAIDDIKTDKNISSDMIKSAIQSRLVNVRGWIYGISNSHNDAINDLDNSYKLDNSNLRSLFLLSRIKVSLLNTTKKGDFEFAKETIDGLYEFLFKSIELEYSNLNDNLSNICNIQSFITNQADLRLESGTIFALFLLIDACFKRGPKKGITITELYKLILTINQTAEQIISLISLTNQESLILVEQKKKSLEVLKFLDDLK